MAEVGSWFLLDITSSTACNHDETQISLMIPVTESNIFSPTSHNPISRLVNVIWLFLTVLSLHIKSLSVRRSLMASFSLVINIQTTTVTKATLLILIYFFLLAV
jgi:hypothetical protein